MARTPEITNLVEVLEDLSYKPLPKDKELKARFWIRAASDPMAVTDIGLTRANAERLCQAKLSSWDLPGFQSWFLNKDEFRQRIEYSAMLALDALDEVLVNNDPKAQGARVQAIKVAMDLAGRTPRANTNIQVNNVGSQIATMDKKQLEAYIAKSSQLLSPPPIEITIDNEEEV